MKRNNASPKFKDWTTKKLKDELNGLLQTMEVGGFSCNDVMMRDGMEAELQNRGVTLVEQYKFN